MHDEVVEKLYDEWLEEVLGENSYLLKSGDPVRYEVGKNDFEREILGTAQYV